MLAGLFPWEKAGVVESPFVEVFDNIGIPYAADIMNFVIITAVLSVANSGVIRDVARPLVDVAPRHGQSVF